MQVAFSFHSSGWQFAAQPPYFMVEWSEPNFTSYTELKILNLARQNTIQMYPDKNVAPLNLSRTVIIFKYPGKTRQLRQIHIVLYKYRCIVGW